jgi:hypothetical protein
VKIARLVDTCEWHKRYLEDRESVKHDDRPGRPCIAVTNDNMEKVRDMTEGWVFEQ